MYNTVVKNLTLLIVSLIVSASAAEIGFRVAGFAPREVQINPFFVSNSEVTWSVPDAELGWINKVGVSRSIEEGHVLMTFWDFGRRATRADAARPDGKVPVMVIGGSNAQSYGVRDEESFVYILGERYPQLWLENFGNGGYSTVQALMLGEKAYAEFYTSDKPKLILLAFDDSHAVRNVADQSWVYSISDDEGRYVAPPHYRISDDAFVFHPFRRIGFWPLERKSALSTVLHNVWLQSVVYDTVDQALPVTRHIIERLSGFASTQGVQFAAVVLEDRSQIADALFSGQSFPYKNCSEPGRSDPDKYLLGGNSHPNAGLHLYFANCIAEWLDTDVLPLLTASALPTAREKPP